MKRSICTYNESKYSWKLVQTFRDKERERNRNQETDVVHAELENKK